tara:strand:+ start:390 stop:575 length:186 start_codon:yes stop_codon:yes gene_type:complete
MTKSEAREVSKTIQYGAHLGADYIARALSALYRATSSNKTKAEMLALAEAHDVTASPDWII